MGMNATGSSSIFIGLLHKFEAAIRGKKTNRKIPKCLIPLIVYTVETNYMKQDYRLWHFTSLHTFAFSLIKFKKETREKKATDKPI